VYSYFDWIAFFTRYLLVLSIIGIPMFLIEKMLADDSQIYKIVITIYCILTISWSTLFMEHWKRREALYAVRWGK
jgi:hypothetical protein